MSRRGFIAASGALGALSLLPAGLLGATTGTTGAPNLPARKKDPARVKVVFLYPPAHVVEAGQNEDSWAKHHWFTWPGNQFRPEEQEQVFTRKIGELAAGVGVAVEFSPQPIYQEARVREFIAATKAAAFDAVLVVNFWNTFAPWSYQIASAAAATAIVYQPVGSNHQLPPANLRNAEGMFYIHSIENWEEVQVRPFFHQLPKTAALDVQWSPGAPVAVVKYHAGDDTINCWTGKVVESPASPPTGGCATRVLVAIDKVEDVCDIYSGPHPILFSADRELARRIKVFARMYQCKLVGNI